MFEKDDPVRMGCGGILGVNKGSVEPPRMIRLRYTPEGEPQGHLALVGKGVIYDSGGINLKPSDVSHSQMKHDMTGAGAIQRRAADAQRQDGVEVVNTDAEGQLVTADALVMSVEDGAEAIVDIATLTGVRASAPSAASWRGSWATTTD